MSQKDRFGKEYWWRYMRSRPEMHAAIAPLERVLAVARVSKTVAFVFVPKGWVYNEKVVVFAFDQAFFFTILQSSLHNVWAWQYSSTLKADLNYAPSDCFQTFPFPRLTSKPRTDLERIGEAYHEHRRQLMLARQEGLTATYNRFHDPEEASDDIARLRELHIEMDRAVAAAYGWDPSTGSGQGIDLGHGFRETAQGLRFTLSEPARCEVLTRLLELNHERYAEEVRQGLHEKKGPRKGAKALGKKADERQMSLF